MIETLTKSNPPKRHHFALAEFELDYFRGAKDKVSWYDRKTDAYKLIAPVNVMVENDFNSYTDKDGNKHQDAEKALAEIEGQAAPILKKIHAGNIRLTQQEVSDLGYFILFKWLRTPFGKEKIDALNEAAYKSHIRYLTADPDRFAETTKKMPEYEGKELDTSEAEELRQLIKETEVSIGFPRSYSIRSMLEMGDLWPEVMKRQWTFYFANEGRAFISSDNPSFLEQTHILPRGLDSLPAGVMSYWARTITPLTPRCCLVVEPFYGDWIQPVVVDAKRVRFINSQIALHSRRFLVAHDETLLRSVVSRANIRGKEPLPFKVETSSNPTEDTFFFRSKLG